MPPRRDLFLRQVVIDRVEHRMDTKNLEAAFENFCFDVFQDILILKVKLIFSC